MADITTYADVDGIKVRVWEDGCGPCPDVGYPVEILVDPAAQFHDADEGYLSLSLDADKKLRKKLKKVIKEIEEATQ